MQVKNNSFYNLFLAFRWDLGMETGRGRRKILPCTRPAWSKIKPEHTGRETGRFPEREGIYLDKIELITGESGPVVDERLHSQFIEFLGACIAEGIWVGEDSEIPNINGLRRDTVEALRELQPPVVRWPGGCFADTYHWRDGIGAVSYTHLGPWRSVRPGAL